MYSDLFSQPCNGNFLQNKLKISKRKKIRKEKFEKKKFKLYLQSNSTLMYMVGLLYS